MRKLKNSKSLAVFLSFFLIITLLATNLPELLHAEIAEVTEEEIEQENGNVVTDSAEGDEIKDEGKQNSEAEQKKEISEEDSGKENVPVKNTVNDKNQTDDKQKSTKTGKEISGLYSNAKELTSLSTEIAQNITPVDEFDPMYWMGQRSGGDENRAMVWFGRYWQKEHGNTKSPILWRTLRSDGQGNYGGAVTLLSEYGLNTSYFFKTQYGHNWCSQNYGTSDLRAYMNGVGTGGMTPAETDTPSLMTTGDPWDIAYNHTGGGVGNKKGSFYGNAFNSQEKSLIVSTKLVGEPSDYETGVTVVDKIFALNGAPSDLVGYETKDAVNEKYFSDNDSRRCFASPFASLGENTLTGSGASIGTAGSPWRLRSPYYRNEWYATAVLDTGMVDPYRNVEADATARPAFNIDPASVIFTSASNTGGMPEDTFSDSHKIGLEVTNGKINYEIRYGKPVGGGFESDSSGQPAYGQGASYRIFNRNEEDSKLGISNGSDSSIILSYPSGAAGQYINVMATTENGEKWTGRVKKIADNTGGTVEFSLPQRSSDGPTVRKVRVFAWRENEETKTACIPNYQDLTVTEEESHMLSYLKGGGESAAYSMENQFVVKGSTCTIRPCVFKKTGYYFVGWLGSDGSMYSEGELITPSENLTLTAVWSNNYKTITYLPGRGTGDTAEIKAATNSKVLLMEPDYTPPTGEEFIEWNTAEDGTGTGYQAGSYIQLNSNITLYAVYGVKITVTYDGNGAEEVNTTQNGYIGRGLRLKSNGFTKPGYFLKGWSTVQSYDENSGVGAFYALGATATFNMDTTLYAQWEKATYSIKFDAGGATQGTPPAELKPSYGDTITLPAAGLLRSGQIFDGWNTDKIGSAPGIAYADGAVITIDGSFPAGTTTLYAQWKPAANYTLTYELNKPAGVPDADVDGLASFPAADSSFYNDGINTQAVAKVPGVKIKGFKFMGWSENALTPPLDLGLVAPGTQVAVTTNKTLHAIWSAAPQWKVTYSGTTSGVTGSLPADNSVYYDDGFSRSVTVLDNPQTRTGYTFLGWTTTSGGSTPDYTAGNTFVIAGNTTLYAVWSKDQYTITYDFNGNPGEAPYNGGTVPAAQNGYHDSTDLYAAAQGSMLREHWRFKEWNTQADGSGTSYAPGASITPTGSMTLYAVWETAAQATLTFKPGCSNPEAIASTPAAIAGFYQDGIHEQAVIPAQKPVRTGYTFAGWSTNEHALPTDSNLLNNGSTMTVTADTDLYAIWELNNNQLTYDLNAPAGELTGTPPSVQNGTVEAPLQLHNGTGFGRDHYTLKEWNTQADGRGTSYSLTGSITLNASLTLYAIWDPISYTVKYDRNAPAGSGSAPADQTGTYGQNFIVSSAPAGMENPGKSFNGWNTQADGKGDTYKVGDSHPYSQDLTLYAQWSGNKYEIVFDGNGAEKGTAPLSITPSYGDTVTIPGSDLLKTSQVFDGWSQNNDGSGTSYPAGSTLTIDAAFPKGSTTIYAKWKNADLCRLTYDTNAGSDTVTGTLPAPESYYKDGISNVLKLTNVVPARQGYGFGGWSTTKGGTASYSPGASITLTDNTTLYAVWTEGTYTLIYHFNGGADAMYGSLPAMVSGTPTTTGITVAGQGDLRREHYKFSGWKDGSGTDRFIGDPVTLNDNLELYAQWTPVPEATLTYDTKSTSPETLTPSADSGHYDDGINQEAVITTDIPIRRGYTFHGWSKDPDALPTDPDILTSGTTLTVITDTTLYAVWELNNNTLTYDKNVKAADPDQVQGAFPTTDNGSVTAPINTHNGKGFTRDHYTLKEWNTQADGKGTGYVPGNAVTLSTDLILYAIWDPDTYTVQYDGGGASGTPATPSQSGKYGTSFLAAQPDGLTNPGKTFIGWKDGAGKTYTAGSTYPFVENVKLYAQWSTDTWTLQFDTSGADQGSAITDITAGLSGTVNLPSGSDLKKNQYKFSGWNTAPDGTSGTSYSPGGNFTIQAATPKTTVFYPIWKKADAWQVTYDKNGRTTTSVSGTLPPKVTCYEDGLNETTIIPVNDLAQKGFLFAGWSETSGDGGVVQYHTGDTLDMPAIGKDLKLYAVWTRQTYQLTYHKTDSNATNNPPAPVTGSIDSTDIIAATQGNMYLAGHKFIGWNTEPDYSGAQIKAGTPITLDENKDFYAQWLPVPALSVTYLGGCDTPAEDTAIENTLPKDTNQYFEDGLSGKATVSAVEPIRYGYEFLGWSTNPKDPALPLYHGGDTIAMTDNLKLYAVWDMGQYTLTYHKGEKPAEVSGMMPRDQQGTIGALLTVADPIGFQRPYYTFTGWNTTVDGVGGTAYQGGDKISLGHNTTLYAQWRLTKYNVKFDLNSPAISAAQGTVPGDMSGTYLDPFQAPNPSDFQCNKYKFTGWSTDPDAQTAEFIPGKQYDFSVFEAYGDDVTLYATWVSVPPYEVHYNKGEGNVSGDVPVDNNRYIPGTDMIKATVLGPGNLKRKGYEFIHWTSEPKDNGKNRYLVGRVFTVTKHMMLYAQWAPGTYTLTYDKNGSSVTGKAPATIRSSSVEDITAAGQNTMKRKNYEFLGWSPDSKAKTAKYTKGQKFRILEDTKLYAVWRKLINVSIEKTEGLEETGVGNISVSQGTKLGDLKLPAVKDGYEIEGWLVNGQKVTNPKDYVLKEDSEVQAIVKKKPVEDKKDNNTNNKNDPDKSSDSDSSQNSNKGESNSGHTEKSESGAKGSTGTAAGGKSNPASTTNSTKSYRAGEMIKSEGSTKKTSTKKPSISSQGIDSDQNTETLNSMETAGNPDSSIAKGYTKEPQNCRIHWLLAFGTFISTLYFILRRRYVRKNRLLNMSKAFDIIIPILAAPLIILGWSRGECRYDVYVMIAWGVITLAGMFLLRYAYKKNLEDVQDQVAVLESVTADNKLR